MSADRSVCQLTIAILADWVSRREVTADLRRDIARTLAGLEARDCVPLLSLLAQDTSRPAQVTAAVALARLGEPLGLATLETLRHNKTPWDSRQVIAEALGLTGAAAAAEPLLDMLDDGDYDVRMSAAKSLGSLGLDEAIPALRQAAERDSHLGVRAYAAEALAKLEEPADRPVLARMTHDREPVMRYLGACGLLKRGDATGIDVLGALTSNESEHVQRIAASALCRGNVRPSARLLLELARSRTPYVRACAAKALSVVDGEEPARKLLSLANDRAAFVLFVDDTELFDRPAGASLRVAEIAVEALGRSPAPQAEEVILRLANGTDTATSSAAARALAGRTQFVDDETVSVWAHDACDRVREAAARLMGAKRNPASLEDLLTLADDSSYGVRVQATVALGNLGGEPVMDLLTGRLGDSHLGVQLAAAAGLETMADQAADILVTRINKGDSPGAPANAIWLLHKLGDPQAIRPVMTARGTGEPAIWQRVVAEAVDAGDRTIAGALIQALHNGNPQIRESATEALAVLGDRDAVLPVAELMGDPDWEVRLIAAATLARIGSSAVDLIGRELREGSTSVRAGMASLLGNLRAPETIDALIQALDDPNRLVRANAAEALGRAGDPGAVNALIRAIEDPDRGVRNNAAAALRRLGTPEAMARVKRWTIDRRNAAVRLAGESER